MIPRFFIDRPIFATVVSVIITLAGGLAVFALPVSQYPKVTPPTIQVDCNYPGASARVVSETIASPIEQQVNGVEDMLYMSSQCTSEGTYTLTVTFKPGTDLNMAQVRVLNRVSLAMPQLPDVVRATGITTRKRAPEILLTIALSSPPEPDFPDGRYDSVFLSSYAVLHVKDELSRLPGISDVTVFGQRDYSMRVWVDPEKLAARNLTAADVVRALREQNAQIPAGAIGSPPSAASQPFQLTISAVGRLTTLDDFRNVVVKVGSDGQRVRVRDVATVELGAKSHDVSNRFDTKPTIGLGVFLLSDANALEVAAAIKKKIAEISKRFPPGIKYDIGYDTSPFISESIREVVKSLRDAIILVAIVVLVFLQSWRASIIPLAAVPVAIIGTFAAMYAAGFTINNLTLFGLVLAVGIVVDDAIVVVEAVQHKIELGYAPREATFRAMDDVAGPVIAVGVVLSAVFIPCAFLPGIVGQFFRQFALTIAVSTAISTFNSLSLSPALCALLLKPAAPAGQRGWFASIRAVLASPFTLFNRCFGASGRAYTRCIGLLLRVPVIALAVYAGLVAAGVWQFQEVPTGFIPLQDKGYMIASVQLPDASSAERTREVIQRIARVALDLEMDDGTGRKVKPVKHCNAIAGNSFVLSAYGSNFGSMFIILEGFEKRRSPALYSDKIMARLRAEFEKQVPEAQVNVFGAPAVSGLGRAGGVRIMIEDRGDVGPKELEKQTNNFVAAARRRPEVVGVFTVFKTNSPQVFVDVDRAACAAHGVELGEVHANLQATMGSRYVNDLNLFGRTWQVNVQAAPGFRNQVADIRRLKVRNRHGEMVPLGAVVKAREVTGPLVITRYNMYPAATVNGNVTQGVSTGDAIATLERIADEELPDRMAYEWTELTFIEKLSRDTGGTVLVLSVAFVFLVLAALYESWAFPLAVILVVPVCVASSLSVIWLTNQNVSGAIVSMLTAVGVKDQALLAEVPKWIGRHGISNMDMNIFTQVGFVVLIGLACKNAILIVEFAKVARDRGTDLRTAVLDACKLRFRPIIMTSMAFMLGVLPLAVGTGAGAEMRRALGVAVLGGMLGVTVFGIFLTPVFFALVDRFTTGRVFRHPKVVALSNAMLYVLGLRFVRPLAGAVVAAAGASVRKITRRRFGA